MSIVPKRPIFCECNVKFHYSIIKNNIEIHDWIIFVNNIYHYNFCGWNIDSFTFRKLLWQTYEEKTALNNGIEFKAMLNYYLDAVTILWLFSSQKK